VDEYLENQQREQRRAQNASEATTVSNSVEQTEIPVEVANTRRERSQSDHHVVMMDEVPELYNFQHFPNLLCQVSGEVTRTSS
jgi:hypothetical protein